MAVTAHKSRWRGWDLEHTSEPMMDADHEGGDEEKVEVFSEGGLRYQGMGESRGERKMMKTKWGWEEGGAAKGSLGGSGENHNNTSIRRTGYLDFRPVPLT